MLRIRVIPALLLHGKSLVKTERFGKYQYIGDPANTVRIFNELEVDELCFLDIGAARTRSGPDFDVLSDIATECFMPLSYGGGIESLELAKRVFDTGFEKIVINTAAYGNPNLITEIATVYGSQAVVVSMDVKKHFWKGMRLVTNGGTRWKDASPVDWARRVEELGAGELLLTDVDREGTWSGFNIPLIREINSSVSIPVIAHGGAGGAVDIAKAVHEGGAPAVAVGASVVFQKKGMGVLVNFPSTETLKAMASMKIAIIGNMNNNGFALMRYFRDLGADAHLLLNANDGMASLAHFRPENDTWNFTRWSPYIHRTGIPNAPIAALGFPYAHLIQAFSKGQHPVSLKQIRTAYAGYDRFVASGIIPAIMHRAGLQPTIFYPYSSGVEFCKSKEFVERIQGLRALPLRAAMRRQIQGILTAKAVLNAELGLTDEVLREMGVDPIPLSIPMLYEENRPSAAPTPLLANLALDIENHDITLFHHARLMWKNPGLSDESWVTENKNNDWAIRAFAAFRDERPHSNPLLMIVEYGPSIDETKDLIDELELGANIRWLPKLPRREIMWLLPRVSACFGEFYEFPRALWGGTGWEAMSAGVPLIQGFRFEPGEYRLLYGTPPPPLVPVQSLQDIVKAVKNLYDSPKTGIALGKEAQNWFQAHNGRTMAQSWLSYLS